jgi:peptide/nickel transport system permease protein
MNAVAVAGKHRVVRARRFPIVIGFSFTVIGVVALSAALGSLLAPHNPNTQDVAHLLAKPSGAHWLGTDELGRDVFSRVVAGARTAFVGPLVVAVTAALFGSVLGVLAGFRGGRVDAVIMRYVDLMFALPGLVIVIAVVGAFGGGYWLAVAIFALLSTPIDIRLVRAATLEQTPRPYVEAARALGISNRRIMFRHIWPNVSSVVVAQLFLGFAAALVGLSALAFLGLGSSPSTPDWGQMLSTGPRDLFVNPASVLGPALAIVATATSMNLIGDWLYERLSSRGVTR